MGTKESRGLGVLCANRQETWDSGECRVEVVVLRALGEMKIGYEDPL